MVIFNISLEKCFKLKVHKMLGRETNVYAVAFSYHQHVSTRISRLFLDGN